MTQNDGDARVRLRPLVPDDQDEFIAQARASTGLHHPWYTMPTTPEAFQAYLAKYSQPTAEGLLVCLRDGGALAGMITIDSIVRGRFQSATLSYAAFAPAAGRGYMSEGLGLVLRYAFCELRLHRLEANIQPANQASLRLVEAGVPPGGLLPRHAVHRRRLAGPRAVGYHPGDDSFPPVDPHPTLPVR